MLSHFFHFLLSQIREVLQFDGWLNEFGCGRMSSDSLTLRPSMLGSGKKRSASSYSEATLSADFLILCPFLM